LSLLIDHDKRFGTKMILFRLARAAETRCLQVVPV
jgi:hypothetical protein